MWIPCEPLASIGYHKNWTFRSGFLYYGQKGCNLYQCNVNIPVTVDSRIFGYIHVINYKPPTPCDSQFQNVQLLNLDMYPPPLETGVVGVTLRLSLPLTEL